MRLAAVIFLGLLGYQVVSRLVDLFQTLFVLLVTP